MREMEEYAEYMDMGRIYGIQPFFASKPLITVRVRVAMPV